MFQFIEAVQGSNVAGPAVQTSTLTRHAGADAWDAGACSKEILDGDGFIEWVVPATGLYRAIALSAYRSTPSTHILTLAGRGVYFKGGGTPTDATVVEEGTERVTVTYAANDVFRVQRIAGVVTYYKNGELFYTSTILGPLNGPTVINSVFFSASSTLTNIRLYDAAKRAWRNPLTWTTTLVTASAGAAHVTRRIVVAAPTKMRAGDQLLAVFPSQSTEYIVASSEEWLGGEVTARTATLGRSFRVLRRIVTEDEPRSYSFDLAVRGETLAILLVYRGGEPSGAMYGAAAVDHAAIVTGLTPLITKLRATDLFIDVSFLFVPAGIVYSAFMGTARAEFQLTAIVTAMRVAVLDSIGFPNAGDTRLATKVTGLPGGTSYCSFGVVLPDRPGATSQPMTADVPGAIGLPVEGI